MSIGAARPVARRGSCDGLCRCLRLATGIHSSEFRLQRHGLLSATYESAVCRMRSRRGADPAATPLIPPGRPDPGGWVGRQTRAGSGCGRGRVELWCETWRAGVASESRGDASGWAPAARLAAGPLAQCGACGTSGVEASHGPSKEIGWEWRRRSCTAVRFDRIRFGPYFRVLKVSFRNSGPNVIALKMKLEMPLFFTDHPLSRKV